MDPRKIADVLRGTINPNERQQAEEQLNQIHKIIGFAPTLLQVIMSQEVEMPVRQAGVIYMKNMISQSWEEKEASAGKPIPFHIHEQDRAMLRDSIVDAVIHSPDLIRVQLGTMLNQIIKNDFPGKWTGIVDKINVFLQSNDPQIISGALLCLHSLVKVFEYKKDSDRAPLLEALNLLLPQAYGLMLNLAADTSDLSLLVQKQILKTFYALIQHSLPLKLLTKEKFAEWMTVARNVADRAVPDSTLSVDEEDRPEHPAWKCRKWALHILTRTFQRYGSPGNVTQEYDEFAEFYLNTFANGFLEVMVRILDASRQKIYVSPRVLQLALNYVNHSISHAVCWKLLKPHMQMVIQSILFPLMCFTAEDAELWATDPHEYIRSKFDIFEEYVSPVTAARELLVTICKKRKDQLQPTMGFLVQVLTSKEADASQKDGALHMVGALSEVLVKKKLYRNQMDSLLAQYILPEYQSPTGHLRARACWVMHHFCEVKFKNPELLKQAVEATVHTLLHDPELPVKIEASIALQALVGFQDCNELIRPKIADITLQLLEVLRESENDDMTSVIQRILLEFQEEVAPLAVQICQHLVETFAKLVNSEEEDKALTAMSLINAIGTLINVFEDEEKIIENLEPVALQVIGLILVEGKMEYYEEAFSLIEDLTSSKISANMWKAYELMYQTFQKDAFDYFNEMLPALHNYITVDTEGFLSDPNRVLAAFDMAKTILTGDSGEDPESHAAKLLEVIILQCKGRIDNCIPTFVELALSRLMREINTSELRTMLLQVVIAALYYNPQLLLATLEALPQVAGVSVLAHFVKQWIHDTDCFLGLHDRKLCVLGICTLLAIPPQQRPPVLNEVIQEILPSCILLFDGLKRAYELKAAEDAEDEKSDEEDDADEEGLASDEDEIDDAGQEYLEQLERKVKTASDAAPFPITAKIETDDDDEEDDDDDSDIDECALEAYTTAIDDEDTGVDEYTYFKEVMLHLQSADPAFYNMLTAHLKPEQQKDLTEIVTLADQRRAARESKRIEKQGGYQFVQQTVPTTFNFGGNFSS